MKWFEDVFTKSKLMIVSGALSILTFVALVVIDLATGFYSPIPNYAMFAILAAMLLFAYKKGETSCQKALSAALPACMMMAYWYLAIGTFGTDGSSGIKFLELCMTVIATVIFMNHVILQWDHKGDKAVVLVSQIVLVVGIAVQLAEFLLQLFGGGLYFDWLSSFGVLCAEIMITCIESRIQKYKFRRFTAMQAGTWTEEERQKCKKIFKF